jgi:hypothetical protein
MKMGYLDTTYKMLDTTYKNGYQMILLEYGFQMTPLENGKDAIYKEGIK